VKPFIYGIKPAVLAIIAGAIFKLGKSWELGILGVLVLLVSILGINEIFALLIAVVVGAIYFYSKYKISGNTNSIIPLKLLQLPATAISKISSFSIFLAFFKVCAVLYGSGYVLFAYLDAELVSRGWITQQLLIDAVVVGQFTPGPLLSTATFIGFQLNGLWCATVATFGMVL
jgi:chromate transporter